MPLDRRLFLGLAAAFVALEASRAAPRKPTRQKAARTIGHPVRRAAVRLEGPPRNPLPIPPIVDIGPEAPFTLAAMPAQHAFMAGKPVEVAGYGGTYLGPTLRLRRGETARIKVENHLARPTNVHWHGLLVDGVSDGASHPGIPPQGSWQTALAVDQPAATLWYHAHLHGRVAEDVQDGLLGLLIVEDRASEALGLPPAWGFDDVPLIIQDKNFDAEGRPLYAKVPAIVDHGFRGDRIVVNGALDVVATVPQRLVRLRLLNACNARVLRLSFEDERPIVLIAGDGGFLPQPVSLDWVQLAPGERAELLVDFADGPGKLVTAPDPHVHRGGGTEMMLPDVFVNAVEVCAFETIADEMPAAGIPPGQALPPLPPLTDLERRPLVLETISNAPGAEAHAHHDHAPPAAAMTDPMVGDTPRPEPSVAADPHAAHRMQPPADAPASADPHAAHRVEPPADAAGAPQPAVLPVLGINGEPYEHGRVDVEVALGSSEIWEIASPEMAHPFHVHGATIRVLSEAGGPPKPWNAGIKDTVFVETHAELLVTFPRKAAPDRPFVYHCHVLEHEDAGMMGTLVVT